MIWSSRLRSRPEPKRVYPTTTQMTLHFRPCLLFPPPSPPSTLLHPISAVNTAKASFSEGFSPWFAYIAVRNCTKTLTWLLTLFLLSPLLVINGFSKPFALMDRYAVSVVLFSGTHVVYCNMLVCWLLLLWRNDNARLFFRWLENIFESLFRNNDYTKFQAVVIKN